MQTLQAIQTPAAVTAGRTRNDALDFTKGALVLFMVLYHWLNYFVPLDWDVYRYLRFISTSFIFITGFLVSNVYLAKHAADDRRLHRRLAERGAKILVIFIVLNVTASLVFGGGGAALAPGNASAWDIFVTGNGNAAFSILVPIGYFLLLAPAVLTASRLLRLPLQATGVVAVAAVIVAGEAGVRSANLELIAIALLGLSVGMVPVRRIDASVSRPWLLAAVYVLYLAAITRWNVPFALQALGVCLSLQLIYVAGLKWRHRGVLHRWVVQLGSYTLVTYIAQIVILQLLRRGLRGIPLAGSELLLPFAVTVALTIVVTQVVIQARKRSGAADRLYRAVFA